ncbi:thioesterase superfamily protein [Rhodococcus sp. SMB37]|uniref:thioesterase family protein n=1 Tax=Rhodococcus sp. SMB37 TaxID=2512213 RepID=UPI001050D68B|nr:thioesterase family protein [Rhodococcus sp. SMB37]TCN40057.1 thioesterase superfamily protein [Rhodococcus sp. SMB37]
MSYFERTGGNSFRATEHVGGAWNTAEQHIAPAFGLLAHVVGCDRDARRDDGLVIGRLSYDILGVLPIGDMDVEVTVLRPGRTIELVEAVLSHGGRAAVRLRAWLMAPGATDALEGSALPRIASPDEMKPWDASEVWPGGFIESAEIRRDQVEPGRASFWARSPIPLLADEKVSDLAHAVRLFDISNGMTVRADPKTVAFPNLDLTAHLFRQPHGEWVGFDTTVSFGADGIGLTSSVLHDIYGPIGTMSQILTVRPGT